VPDGFENSGSIGSQPPATNGPTPVSASRPPREPLPSLPQIVFTNPSGNADWITPPDEERGFGRYLEAVWGGRWIVLATIVAALACAVIYVETATKVYQAHASLLVTPLPSSDSVSGLGLIQASSDPLRDIETGAGFVNTSPVAQRAKAILKTKRSTQDLLSHIIATPVAESDTVDVAASDDTAGGAQRLANAFVKAVVLDRTAALHQQLNILIPALEARISKLGSGDGATRSALGGQLAELETLGQSDDPNFRVQAEADAPTSPTSPRKTLTVAAALFGGLVLGVGIVFLTQLLDPRLRREQDLRDRFNIPILARVPKAGGRRWKLTGGGPFTPDMVSPEAGDAYATIRSVMVATKRASPDATTRRGRIVLVTGASPYDGKSTTAINLASALAASSERVILIEGDLRRPSIGLALDVKPEIGLETVLYGETGVKEALIPMPGEGNKVQMLLAARNGGTSQPLMPSRLQAVLLAARDISDWVVVDAPPLIYAPDLLSGSRYLDSVLLVVRLGNTNFKNLTETAEMLAYHNLRPTGFVVVGTSGRAEYY
jgi:Mrp family chromosome partitioning ATPase/capsular polysaccharide biosynthesis protein